MRRSPSAERRFGVVFTPALAAACVLAVVGIQIASPTPAAGLDNGLGLTPQMGWNSWNAYRCNIDEDKIKAAADHLADSGLKDAGYKYVNIDDCWQRSTRDADGRLAPDPTRFSHGIKALADYVHGKGLKLGIYATPGSRSCANIWDNYPGKLGSLGHETLDAQTFADWGVDYLKYDWCRADEDGVDPQQGFTKMRDALAATGRPIFYSIHREPQLPVDDWRATVANSWRTSPDIGDNWPSMIRNVRSNQPLGQYAGPGHWNDPDMLEVGNGGMTDAEYRTHFSLWAIMAAPLLLGTDLGNAKPETLKTLGNLGVIAIDQDPQGHQGTVVSDTGGLMVMAKPLQNGDVAVTLTNTNASTATISTTAADVKVTGSSLTLTDLWETDPAKKIRTVTDGKISADVPSHGTVMYRVSNGSAPSTGGGGVPVSTSVSAGELTMSMADGSKVDLPAVKFGPAAVTSGALPTINVRDYRGGTAGWSLTGRLSGDIASGTNHSIPAANLHWKPACTAATGAPGTCTPGSEGALGTTAATLATAPDASSNGAVTGGDFTAGGQITLNVPAYTPTGTYSTVLTLTLA